MPLIISWQFIGSPLSARSLAAASSALSFFSFSAVDLVAFGVCCFLVVVPLSASGEFCVVVFFCAIVFPFLRSC
jgi:hypothetical protein